VIWEKIVEDWAKEPATPKPRASGAPAVPKGYKRCLMCERVLALKDFYERNGTGYTPRCKSCYMKHQAERKQK